MFPVACGLGQQCPTTLVGLSGVVEIWHVVGSGRSMSASAVETVFPLGCSPKWRWLGAMESVSVVFVV